MSATPRKPGDPPRVRRTRVLETDRGVRAFLEYAAQVIPPERPMSRDEVLDEAARRVASEPPPERDDVPDEARLYYALRKQGLCVRCKARCAHSLCPECVEFRRQRKLVAVARGMCDVCGKPSPGKRTCARCQTRHQDRKRERRARR